MQIQVSVLEVICVAEPLLMARGSWNLTKVALLELLTKNKTKNKTKKQEKQEKVSVRLVLSGETWKSL